jgi:hypothetical protein
VIVVILGFIFPFIDYLTIIEMFYLLIPFGIIVIVTFGLWIFSLFYKNMNSKISFLFFLIIPVFIGFQLVSGFVVDKIQRFRSDRLIIVIDEKIKDTGNIPDHFDTNLGIKYKKSLRDNNYSVSYSRGFMVTEKYDSNLKAWKSYGWND